MTVSDWVVAYVVPITLPVLIGVGVLRLGRRASALALHPVRTTYALFLLLVVLNSIDTLEGDLVTPTIAGIVSIVVCVAIYLELRRGLALT
jgi:hypothetical protein